MLIDVKGNYRGTQRSTATHVRKLLLEAPLGEDAHQRLLSKLAFVMIDRRKRLELAQFLGMTELVNAPVEEAMG